MEKTYIIFFHHIHTMMTFPLKSYLVKKVLKMWHELKIESKSDSAIAVIGYDDIIMKKLKLNIIEGQNISSYTGDNIPLLMVESI